MWQRRTVQSWLKFDRQITKNLAKNVILFLILYAYFYAFKTPQICTSFLCSCFSHSKTQEGRGSESIFLGKARSQTTLFSYWPPFFSKPSLAPKIVASRPTSNDSRMLCQSVERHRKVRGPCRACSTRTRNCSLQYQVSTEAVPASTKSF